MPVSAFLSISVYGCICLFLCPSLCVCLSLAVSVFVSVCLRLCLSLPVSVFCLSVSRSRNHNLYHNYNLTEIYYFILSQSAKLKAYSTPYESYTDTNFYADRNPRVIFLVADPISVSLTYLSAIFRRFVFESKAGS